MQSPFPGMDPYIEASGLWATFHHAFLTACHNLLNDLLPSNYVASLGERIELVDTEEFGRGRSVFPDIAIVQENDTTAAATAPASSVATLEPVTLPQSIEWPPERKHLYIEIVELPDRHVVTDIELLSPSNKRKGSDDRTIYLAKRQLLLRHHINLVELDLLLAGERLPLLAPLPRGDYFAFVSHGPNWHQTDVYAWSVRQRLPMVPIPLKQGADPIALDLSTAFSQTYQHGRYGRLLAYDQAPSALLDEPNREWASNLLQNR